VDYIVAGRAVLGAVPTQTCVIAERFFDEGGGMQLVIPRAVRRPHQSGMGLALRKRFCRSFNFELQAARPKMASTSRWPNSTVSRSRRLPFLSPASVREVSSRP
jgi:ATP-dependent Lhr-like helicase